jgi:hypothetical protein
MMFIKLSIGILLLRVATQKVYIWILRVSLVVITVWTTALFFWNIFQCDPVAKQWDYRIARGHCVGPEEVVAAAYALSAMTILSDWLFVRGLINRKMWVLLLTLTPGTTSRSHALERQNVQAGETNRHTHPQHWRIVSPSHARVCRFARLTAIQCQRRDAGAYPVSP